MTTTTQTLKNPMARAKKIVIKIGSAVLTQDSGELDLEFLKDLAAAVSKHMKAGKQILIVSSGAVASGRGTLGMMGKRKFSLSQKQALASVGQAKLMGIYSQVFAPYGISVGQILMTKDDLENRLRDTNIRCTLDELLHLKCVPIINENDSTVVDELFGDNDTLASLVAAKVQAEAFIILSDVDGLFDKNPVLFDDAVLLPFVPTITKELIQSVTPPEFAKDTKFGTGGMKSKLRAAQYASNEGVNVMIGNGKTRGCIDMMLSGKGGGTFFPAHQRRHNSRQQWLLAKKTRGSVMIDEGAANAIMARQKSLLAAGVKGVEGTFKAGDVIAITDMQGKVLGNGIMNYSSAEITRIKGLPTAAIKRIVGERHYYEAVHHDDLAIY
ncbi:glutamate 5-kinase [Candidatus Sumerlaeota bacterium]|nr:glutamate 5-kinase [Candidatus Sumerlaeota bacterium]